MRRLMLIANPLSSGFTGALHRDVVSILSRDFEVVAVWPNSPPETCERSREAAAEGFDVVAAMGGDGVAHHVANGLALGGTALGIIPTGTTNVLARIIGMPLKPRRAAMALANAQVRPMPIAHLATDSTAGARSEFATFSVGIGLDADVVAAAERRPHSKLHFGSLHYARTAIAIALGAYRTQPASLRVHADGTSTRAVAVVVQVRSPYSFFGRIPIDLDPRGGEMAAVTIERVTVPLAARVLGRLLQRASFEGLRGLHTWRDFGKIVIEAEPGCHFQADGELLGTTEWLEISLSRDSLLALIPRQGGDRGGEAPRA